MVNQMGRMMRVVFLKAIAASCVAACGLAFAAPPQDAISQYKLAESFLPGNLQRHIYIPELKPQWSRDGDKFRYVKQGPSGRHLVLVDPATGSKVEASPGSEGAVRRPEAVDADAARGSRSPDGEWTAFVQGHNLYVRHAHDNKVLQLTADGRARNDYARPLAGLEAVMAQGVKSGEDAKLRASVYWSPDSTRLITYRLDSTQTQRMGVTQFVPGHKRLRPITYEYALSMPGRPVSHAYPIIFKIGAKPTKLEVKTDPLLVPYQQAPRFRWSKDGARAFYLYFDRGDKYAELREVDAETGEQRVVHHEAADPYPYIVPGTTTYEFARQGAAFLWTSERSGWNQIYLYDLQTGKPIGRVTEGDWNVQKIVRVDDDAGQVYFTANGVDPKLNPYFSQLYRVNFDGTGMTLLTPGDANHTAYLSPDGKYLVDDYSRPDNPGASVLRRSNDGRVVVTLEQGDTQWLVAAGWVPPLAFKGLAADGKTPIHGTIFLPPAFDPAKKYPVVENLYPGPQRFREPVTFREGLREQGMAALGFVVVVVDGRGSAGRSRDFRDFSYRNIAGALVDHVALIKQMAEKYPWLDVDHVGVYGTSEGGYATAQAMLMFPDFYKVGVATSGNYISLMTKAVYSELYQGYPVGDNYRLQSSDALAANLKGHLLLIHGDVDPNVNAAQMLRFADALMSAGKDFDMLLVPNMSHGASGPHKLYVTRRSWDYFFRYLAGRVPPENFRLDAGG